MIEWPNGNAMLGLIRAGVVVEVIDGFSFYARLTQHFVENFSAASGLCNKQRRLRLFFKKRF